MIKELKYFLYILTISLFVFFIVKIYFSDENKKESYRSIEFVQDEIDQSSNNLKILKSNTDNIVEYVEDSLNNEKKKYRFLELLTNVEK